VKCTAKDKKVNFLSLKMLVHDLNNMFFHHKDKHNQTKLLNSHQLTKYLFIFSKTTILLEILQETNN